MADDKNSDLPERITVLAKDFTPAAMEFHRRNMSEKGYRMEGQIVQRRFRMIEGLGDFPTISKPNDCQSLTARSLALTTKLNCMALNPYRRANSSECKHIARATPRLVAWPAVT